MSGFDPITYAMALEAKLPAGALMPAFAVDPAVLQQGWCHLDGSLVSRSQYPAASQIVGDVRFYDGTPTEVLTNLTLRSGVDGMNAGKSLAIGSVFIVAPSHSSSAVQGNFRLWRSGDAGANWSSIDLGAFPAYGTSLSVEYLEWFGGGRVLLLIHYYNGTNTGFIVTFSSDYGQTWSTPKSLASVSSGSLTLQSVSADAEMCSAGQGYYYFGFQDTSVSPYAGRLWALNVGTNTAYSYTIPGDGTNNQHCQLLGGRVVSGGTSEVHFAGYYTNTFVSQKVTFSGTAFSGQTSSGIAYNANYYGAGRPFLTANNANQFVTRGTMVYQLPAAWSGTPTLVHTGIDNVGQRLLTNTLSNPNTGERYDLATGVRSVAPGFNAGAPKTGAQFGHPAKYWIEAVVTDKTPSNDRHFLAGNGVANSFAVRTTRCADNFLGAFGSGDTLRSLTYAAAGISWYDSATGQYKTVDFISASPYKLRVRTYTQANDYANYLHLPYLPGVLCRMR